MSQDFNAEKRRGYGFLHKFDFMFSFQFLLSMKADIDLWMAACRHAQMIMLTCYAGACYPPSRISYSAKAKHRP